MTVQLDIVREARILDGVNGVEVTRTGRVSGIGGQPELRARAALTAPGMPRKGDRLSGFPGLQAVEISLSAIDVESWEVTITYRRPSAAERARIAPLGSVVDREWFAVTVTEELSEDINGEPLYHWYFGKPVTPTIIGSGIRFLQAPQTQFVWKQELARVQKPSLGMRVTLVDSAPIERWLPFSGTVNSAFWDGYPAQTWLVGGLDSQWDLDRWRNTYELFYNPKTWQFRSRVEYFGAPPSDAVLGNGIAEFDIYPSRNFNALPFKLR